MNEPGNSASLIEERPYSLNRGCEGCLAAWLMLVAFMVLVSFVHANFGWLDPEYQSLLFYFEWLLATAVGGYVAARRGKKTGWTNSLLVGIFAQFVIVGQVVDKQDMLAALSDLLVDPSESWPKLMAILLTIPAAVAGGLAWSRKRQ